MKTWKQPLPSYEWLIHQVWLIEVDEGEIIEPKPHLIPNSRAHLLFTPPQQPYSYDNGHSQLQGLGSHLLTASEHLLLLEDQAPLLRIGITFRPEGLKLLNSNAVVAPNQCEWFEWLPCLFDDDFQRHLLALTARNDIIEHIHQHLDKLGLTPPVDRNDKMIQKAVSVIDSILEHNDHVDIEALAEQCACSRRTLERTFKDMVGLSIKQYQKMTRLEQMILSLYQQDKEIDWSDFAQQFGFSDQSHLIRTLKQQLKRTPSKYLKNRDLTIDIYGDFED
ncbi:helix-turn-helix domain-containing protein [Vibrio fortis]|uniref:helix-turn-helix domain-containing protein n=1 Tax=Vibrio fortis TaxID=212667 RepID=UPI0038CD4274